MPPLQLWKLLKQWFMGMQFHSASKMIFHWNCLPTDPNSHSALGGFRRSLFFLIGTKGTGLAFLLHNLAQGCIGTISILMALNPLLADDLAQKSPILQASYRCQDVRKGPERYLRYSTKYKSLGRFLLSTLHLNWDVSPQEEEPLQNNNTYTISRRWAREISKLSISKATERLKGIKRHLQV